MTEDSLALGHRLVTASISCWLSLRLALLLSRARCSSGRRVCKVDKTSGLRGRVALCNMEDTFCGQSGFVCMQERANDTEYGLAAGVFTSNLNMATTISRGLRAGTVWVSPRALVYVRWLLAAQGILCGALRDRNAC